MYGISLFLPYVVNVLPSLFRELKVSCSQVHYQRFRLRYRNQPAAHRSALRLREYVFISSPPKQRSDLLRV